MKAITLYQPWASLIKDKRKTVETRSWPTKYRGRLSIHAGKKVNAEACVEFGYDQWTIERGVILCIVKLVDCIRFPDPRVRPDEYGDFAPGRYGWILTNVRPLNPPIPMKGKMGLWNVKPSDLQEKGKK